MNRVIKFRGRRVDNSEWIYGNLVIDCEGICMIWDFADHKSDSYTQEEVIKETIGQYTGLKDCKGKEVFEGDIVRQDLFGRQTIRQVKWDNECVGFYPFSECSDPVIGAECGNYLSVQYCEVIGNVWESPTLLDK